MTEQFKADVAMLAAAYKEDGKVFMLCKFKEILTARKMVYWEAAAMIDQVWMAIVPGNDKAARLARNKLIKA